MEVLGTICCLCDHNWQRTPLDHFWQTHAQVCTFQMTPKTQRTGLLMKFRYPHLFKVWHLCLHEFPGQGSNSIYDLSPIWEFRWISTGADSYVINGTFLYNQLATDYRSDMALTKHLFRWLKTQDTLSSQTCTQFHTLSSLIAGTYPDVLAHRLNGQTLHSE